MRRRRSTWTRVDACEVRRAEMYAEPWFAADARNLRVCPLRGEFARYPDRCLWHIANRGGRARCGAESTDLADRESPGRRLTARITFWRRERARTTADCASRATTGTRRSDRREAPKRRLRYERRSLTLTDRPAARAGICLDKYNAMVAHRPARSGMRPSWKSGCELPPKFRYVRK